MPSWESITKHFDENIESNEIDELLKIVASTTDSRLKEIDLENETLSSTDFEDPLDLEPYRMHLYDQAYETESISNLAGQVAILALYSKIETHTKKVAVQKIPLLQNNKLHHTAEFQKAVGFNFDEIDGYAEFNELRLINNSIKHEGSVSQELAKNYHNWQIGAELNKLSDSYTRLLPGVKKYVKNFVGAIYSRTKLQSTP